MIVKALKLRQDLKSLLKMVLKGEDRLVLDYYGELFEIVPLKSSDKTQNEKIIDKYSQLGGIKLVDSIFDENKPDQEKKNIRDYLYGTKSKKGVLEK